MSAPELIFRAGDLTVTVAEHGLPRSVEHRSRPGQNYLAARAPGRVDAEGAGRDWEFAGMITDTDETEVRYAVAGLPEVEYTVRNSFTGSWLQRHVLQNTSSTSVRIDQLVLPLAPGPDCVGWGMAAGANSCWVIQPADGLGPLLTGRLTQGVLAADAADGGFGTGPLLLRAGRRFVLQWQIGSSGTVGDLVRDGMPITAARMELPAGEPYEIDDADAAVVVPDSVWVDSDGPVQLVNSDRPGRFPVEIRSARGTGTIDVAWVPPVDQVITDLTREWLSRERSGAGVGVLRGSGSALAVQQAVTDRLTDDVEDAEDALELYAARLLEQDRLSIMDVAFLAQETIRTGDLDPLRRARSEFLSIPRFQPGLGLAALRILVAELTGGGEGDGILNRLHDLPRPAPGPVGVGDDHLLAAACRLEAIASIGPGRTGTDSDAELVGAVRAIGAELGFGLSGHRLGSLRPSIAVYAAGVIDMLPEGAGADLGELWGSSQQLLAERTRTSALAALLWPADHAVDDLADALGWMALGRPLQ